jgi:inorganic pyrophosphatase
MSEHPAYYQWRPHPWHGLEAGSNPPSLVQVYVELTPFDVAKYELDKVTGYLKVNRLQKTSATPPTIYGLIPRTLCGERVGKLCSEAKSGDGDPLDICVVTSRQINQHEILLDARVIGGIQTIDHDQADDKIIAVLDNDDIWGNLKDIVELPDILTERLRHYFGTYKATPEGENAVKIQGVYGFEHACRVVTAAMEDYQEKFG